MYRARATELIPRGFVGRKSNKFQDSIHWDQETNGLVVNSGQWSPPLEPPEYSADICYLISEISE